MDPNFYEGMMPTQVLADLYQIVVPTPYAVGPVNLYLATTDPITLIDSGPLQADTRTALDAGLTGLGVARRDIRRIVITHAHADHYGLAAELVRDSGATVWTHRFNRGTLEAYEPERRLRSEFYRQVMIESNVPAEEQPRIAEGWRSSEGFAEAVKVDYTIDEGDMLECAHRSWRVYHTPGHAGGLICLFNAESRVLLSNDHLLRDISSNPVIEPALEGGPRPHRLLEYQDHLQRMADLKPAIAWTGHGRPVHAVQRLVQRRIAFHERRADQVLEIIGANEVTAYDIAQSLFGRLSGIDLLLALSETIGHLEWLEEQQRIESIERNAIVYWWRK